MDKKILNFYTDEKLQDIKNLQFQNKFISEHKEEFFSVCNKILDFLYTEEEVDSKRDEPMYEDITVIKDTTKDFEFIRKKIQNGAPLSGGEVSALLVACQYVCTDMSRLAAQYAAASKELESYIKTLTFQDK
jgi:Asp-tRNA(Asn)/Glu-tRNA(Gln) amidotransferase C subunit